MTDTHGGAGLYDLQDAMAKRSREAETGIVRLMADDRAPEAFASLKAAVAALNPQGGVRYYPGSPLLTVNALRRGDRLLACELRPDDQAALQGILDRYLRPGGPQARAVLADGYAQLGEQEADRRPVYLVDPPFERGDEYAQVISGVDRALRARSDAVVAIWAPLKDLETFDALLRGVEALDPLSILVVQARLRPMLDPMKMNGSAMLIVGGPALEPDAAAISEWIVSVCGDPGAKAIVQSLKP